MARWRTLCNRHFIVSGESGESPGEASGKRGRGSRARERRSPGRSLQKPRRSRMRPLPNPPAFASGQGCWLVMPRAGPGARARVLPCVHAGCWFWVVLQENRAFHAIGPGLLDGFSSAITQLFGKTPGRECSDSPLERFQPPKPPRTCTNKPCTFARRDACSAIPSAARPRPCA